MKSVVIPTFLSCSGHSADQELREFVRAICAGLDMECFTVERAHNDGYPIGALEKARDEIRNRRALVVIATCRTERGNGRFGMSDAVAQEFNLCQADPTKRFVLLAEEGLEDARMGDATRLTFNRTQVHTPDFVRLLVRSLHELKSACISRSEVLREVIEQDFYAEEVQILRRLVFEKGEFLWDCHTTKVLRFRQRFEKGIDLNVWPAENAPDVQDRRRIKWKVNLGTDADSQRFTIREELVRCTATHLNARLYFDPPPEAGQSLTYSIRYRSRYLTPLFREKGAGPVLRINARDFVAYDGIVPVHRIQALRVAYEFPTELRISQDDVAPFAALYSNRAKDVMLDEISRMKGCGTESFRRGNQDWLHRSRNLFWDTLMG